jgi:heat shock protein HslJ
MVKAAHVLWQRQLSSRRPALYPLLCVLTLTGACVDPSPTADAPAAIADDGAVVDAIGGAALPPSNSSASGTTAGDATQRMLCGAQLLAVTASPTAATVSLDERRWQLARVRSASGARYTTVATVRATDPTADVATPVIPPAAGMPSTQPLSPAKVVDYWHKGARSMLTIDGRILEECRALQAVVPLTVKGNHPPWQLRVDEHTMTLAGPHGAAAFEASQATGQDPGPRHRRYIAQDSNGRLLTADVRERVCRDSTSGTPYPLAVAVHLGDLRLEGCGGSPSWLLAAGAWRVVSVGVDRLPRTAVITIDFRSDGLLTGAAGCNRYRTDWALAGNSLQIRAAAATRRACQADLMHHEQRFLAQLTAITGFDIDAAGALRLNGADGNLIIAELL